MNIIRLFTRTWFTGSLYLLAVLGYGFYFVLWIVRFMQTRTLLLISVIAACSAIACLAGYLFFPLHGAGRPVKIIVAPKTPLKQIGHTLKRERIIPSSTAFFLWIKASGTERRIQAGRFTFYRQEGIITAAKKLLHAEPIEVSITFPEGLTISQTAALAAATLHIDSAEFAFACLDSGTMQVHEGVAGSCEGYLFPDTYLFPPDVKARDVVKRMTDHFEEMYRTILPAGQAAPTLSRRETVVLASIIEKEATVASERPLISGVFHNRLEKKIPLGADPCVRYVVNKFTGPLLASDLSVSSPYNTRLHAGLPPGPICSPGLASLKAAMVPEKTKYLYFVAKWDGSGSHFFSLTNKEHEERKGEARRRNESRRMQAAGAVR
jgi:UPF0755 protein